jgi:hypothetical protein
MNPVNRKLITAGAMVLTLGLGPAAFAQANDPEAYGDGYQSGAYGRVRSADRGGTIVRADGEQGEPDRATVNAPLFPGDTLRTDQDQRVEVQLAGGTTVRIDRGADIVFQSLPNADAKYQDNSVLVLNAGVIRVTSRLNDKEEFRVDTRDASVYMLGEGEFRIETDTRGGTRVASLRGVAEVVGNDASVLVRGGMRTVAVAGSAPDTPGAYSAFASDGFDRWCGSRDDASRGHDRYAAGDDDQRGNLPDEVRPYYGELSAQGSFDVDPDYGTVWYPTGVASDWRPYNDGYWSYGPGGYFWVANEPWGWAPYHYGNWQWTARHHWCWVPGPVFAGAWVSWSWGSLTVGWAPLDFWGRPGWIGGSLYNGFYDPGCWTFVGYGHFHDHDIRRAAVPIDTIRDDLRHATVVARPPSVDPRRIAESPLWRGRALRQVVDDHGAQLGPIQTDRRPEQRLSDVQNHLMRRPQQGSAIARAPRGSVTRPSVDPRVTAPRPRRIFEDPRASVRPEVRPETRNDVRELYQRMSRPRETRAQDTPAPRHDTPANRTEQWREAPGNARPDVSRTIPRGEAPRASRHDDPRFQPRYEAPSAPRQDAPRFEPRTESPRAQAPRAQAPHAQAPPPQAPRPQAPQQHGPSQAKPKHGDRH